MSIIGVGTDLVGVPRFERALQRTPGLLPRVFTDAERVTRSGKPRRPHSLAARFAAKEAAAKALGVPRGWRWHDTEVIGGPNGRPLLRITGSLARAAQELGVTGWHVSLTHDAELAAAVVVAESSGAAGS
jgi:holo-[acyl-carrier protein] synthase